MADKTPNQATRQSDQNYTVDIDQLYKKWISSIDEIRSYASIGQGKSMKELLGTNDNNTTMAGFIRLIKVESTYQESRCHAFYRWMGFPVIDEGGSIYNPGFDIIKCAIGTTSIFKKKIIAKNPEKGFDKLSDEREGFAKDMLKIFSQPQNITASAVALSSGGTKELRKFAAHMENLEEPFDMDAAHQTNEINIESKVGEYTVFLSEYKDSGGNEPDLQKLKGRPHIITPLIVDARIDFAVTPQSRLIAVPFVPDDSYLKSSSTTNVSRPLIEHYIRERVPAQKLKNDPGTYVNEIEIYLNKAKNITNRKLITSIQTRVNLLKQSDQDRFLDTIDIIRALMSELVNAKRVIQKAQGHYYWVPNIGFSGPEGVSKVQGVFLPKYISSEESHELITEKDTAIIEASMRAATNNINISATTLTGKVGASSFNLPTTDFTARTTDAVGDNNATNLESLSKIRARVLTKANNALRTIEIIMGEFSGFGLCDIIAITGAMQILPIEDLFGLLDTASFARMQKSLNYTESITPSNFQKAHGNLTSLVRDFYNLMDSIYKDESSGTK